MYLAVSTTEARDAVASVAFFEIINAATATIAGIY